jgi:diacylglycerol kinase family enzyme
VTAAGREEIALVMAGLGADAAVLADTREPLKRLIGAGAYLFAGMRHVRARPVHTSIAVDGAPPVWGYTSLVGIGNVGELRPGVALMPEADAADGRLDVVAASPRHARDVLRMMAGTLVGSRREPGLDRYRGARVEVTTASPVPCHVDGDILGEVTSLTVEVLPAALRVARTVTRER